jgi:hypothetical protein
MIVIKTPSFSRIEITKNNRKIVLRLAKSTVTVEIDGEYHDTHDDSSEIFKQAYIISQKAVLGKNNFVDNDEIVDLINWTEPYRDYQKSDILQTERDGEWRTHTVIHNRGQAIAAGRMVTDGAGKFRIVSADQQAIKLAN